MAGDVSDDLATLRHTFSLLLRAFAHVFFIPGNHDVWVRRHERGTWDSLGKLAALRADLEGLGVKMGPARVGGVWVVPLYRWYHASWDREPEVPEAMPIEKASAP